MSNGESLHTEETMGLSMLPLPLQLKKIPDKPGKNKSFSFKQVFNDFLGKADGLHGAKKINNVVKFADDKSGAMDKTKAGAGAAGNVMNMAKGAAEKMGLKNTAEKFENLAGNTKLASGILGLFGDPSTQDIVESGMDISAVLLEKSGNKYLANMIGDATLPVAMIFNLYDVFDNYFGSFEAARQAKMYKNFRLGFARGMAASLLHKKAKDQKERTVKMGVAERVSRTIGVAEAGNNKGVDAGYAYANSLPSGYRKILLKLAKNALKDGGDNEYWLNQKGVVPDTLMRTLLPAVDAVFTHWQKEKAREEREKKAEEYKKMMGKKNRWENFGGGKM